MDSDEEGRLALNCLYRRGPTVQTRGQACGQCSVVSECGGQRISWTLWSARFQRIRLARARRLPAAEAVWHCLRIN